MLRGIFSGKCCCYRSDSLETEALNKFFAGIVIERGEEPAPRDLIPMHPPVALLSVRPPRPRHGEENGSSLAAALAALRSAGATGGCIDQIARRQRLLATLDDDAGEELVQRLRFRLSDR